MGGHKQTKRFLERIDDNFHLQGTEESTRRGAMLDLVPTSKEGLGWNVNAGGMGHHPEGPLQT